jgi:hypothetical protein
LEQEPKEGTPRSAYTYKIMLSIKQKTKKQNKKKKKEKRKERDIFFLGESCMSKRVESKKKP